MAACVQTSRVAAWQSIRQYFANTVRFDGFPVPLSHLERGSSNRTTQKLSNWQRRWNHWCVRFQSRRYPSKIFAPNLSWETRLLIHSILNRCRVFELEWGLILTFRICDVERAQMPTEQSNRLDNEEWLIENFGSRPRLSLETLPVVWRVLVRSVLRGIFQLHSVGFSSAPGAMKGKFYRFGRGFPSCFFPLQPSSLPAPCWKITAW